jgi:hypothetical protein
MWDDRFIEWLPVVVPGLAVVLLVAVYLILTAAV